MFSTFRIYLYDIEAVIVLLWVVSLQIGVWNVAVIYDSSVKRLTLADNLTWTDEWRAILFLTTKFPATAVFSEYLGIRFA